MKNEIKKILENYLKENNIEFDNIIISVPNEKENGDFSSNLALQLTKIMKKNPMEIGEEIKNFIKNENISKIEIKKPGFLNFFIKEKVWEDNLNKVLLEKDDYGRGVNKNEKVDIEFVSANPTGILHVGHARGACYGDSLSRIMNFAGFDTTKEYYINDLGNQINNLGMSLNARYFESLGFSLEMPKDGYYGKEIILLAEELKKEYGDSLKNSSLDFFKEYGLTHCMEVIKKDLKDLNVVFDVFVSEKSLYEKGEVEKSLNVLKEKCMTYEKDGALWLKTSDYGDDKDRVLVKSDGVYTYLTPDIANHKMKFDRGFDKLINIWGADHYGYIPRIKAAVDAIGYDSDKIDVKILQMVRLIEDGKEVKMSKRTGKSVTLRELLDEIGVSALRYSFTSKRLDTQMDFDMDLAKQNTNENPVYYVCYAYARICSILKSCDKEINVCDYKTFSENEFVLLKKIYEFPSIVEDSASKKLPHLIANYVYELASLFHSYYSKERVITDDSLKTEENINLIKGVQITLKNALNLLGITPEEKM